MESFQSASGFKQRHSSQHFPSSPTPTERDTTDSEGEGDSHEIQGVSGKEHAVLKIAEELMYMRTLFVNPFLKVVTLNSWVVEVWEEAQEILGDVEQSGRSRALVRGSD